ncbi:phage major capsid protein, P2 family [Zoogloea sp. LCSB751]|uniref:phage major capsid protein, P2 family n=1 Tax=Zoogloea sp. LCSB751 TaxID=1965277 RepID=UPI001C1F8E87|nr:phage major capsid protein, P2 family [Zoogloea sp. LCSB751]
MNHYAMQPGTAKQLDTYRQALARMNGADSAERNFTVAPSVAQALETKMQETSEFLSLINIQAVDEAAGDLLGLNVSSTIAGRTPTNAVRMPADPTTLDGTGYLCRQTDFDTYIEYSNLDQWAKFPDFQSRIRNAILQQMARDRLMIGWNGTSAASTTNRIANPLLQDVNIGWIQKLRIARPGNVLSECLHGSGKVLVGMTGDYSTIDSLARDVFNNLIPSWYQDMSFGYVAIMGRALGADRLFPLINATQPPSEMMAADVIRYSKKLAGTIPVVEVPFFPERSLMITPLSNLSIYWQRGTRRRRVVDNPARNRIEDYQSINEDYVIEQPDQCVLIENIEFIS